MASYYHAGLDRYITGYSEAAAEQLGVSGWVEINSPEYQALALQPEPEPDVEVAAVVEPGNPEVDPDE